MNGVRVFPTSNRCCFPAAWHGTDLHGVASVSCWEPGPRGGQLGGMSSALGSKTCSLQHEQHQWSEAMKEKR